MTCQSAGWIHAFKSCDGGITSCELDDPGANLFRVHWRGSQYSGTAIDFDSKYKAEWVVIAINDAFKAGGRNKLAELRTFLGVSGR